MHETPLSLCLKVIVNEKPLNLETATSSVLSVIVNNLWVIPCPYLFTSWSSKNEITQKTDSYFLSLLCRLKFCIRLSVDCG